MTTTRVAVAVMIAIGGVLGCTSTPPAKGAMEKASAADSTHKHTRSKLSELRAREGTMLTLGYTDLGKVSIKAGQYSTDDIAVDAREMRVSDVNSRGLLITHDTERDFVDEDEIAPLLAGMDSLFATKANPTKFRMFERSYETRDGFRFTAFSSSKGDVSFAVHVGSHAMYPDEASARRLRGLVEAGKALLDSLKR